MPDMLVSVLNVPDDREMVAKLREQGVNIRRAMPYEMSIVRKFVEDNFSTTWADEVMNAFCHHPVTCFIATENKKIIGFGAYESTCRDYFGPTGVKESERGRGLGKALLYACLRGLRELGYAYAIIGGAGPTDFYAKAAGATVVPQGTPSIYGDYLDRT